jgi:parallel beta-helix repeat protein
MYRRSCLALPLLLVVGLTACGGGGGGGGSGATPPVALAAVAALFPANGANWNDYVAGSASTATDSACNASSDSACVHGGERRAVVAAGRSSCTGLTAADALGTFDWACDGSTNPVRLVSTGLAEGKYLSDLIDFNTPGFKPNKVTVYDNGTAWGVTPSSVWWTNAVAVNNGGGSLANASTIYLVTSNPAALYTLDADKVALVIKPGVTLTGPGTNANVISSTHSHLWLEAMIDATGDAIGIDLNGVLFSALHNVTVSNSGIGGVVLASASNHNTLSAVSASNDGTGISLDSASNNNTLSGVTASNNFNGIYLNSASNTLSGGTASNNANVGIFLASASNNNTLSDVTASNNVNLGVLLASASNNNTLSAVTASNNSGTGVLLNSASNNTLSAVTASNNSIEGVFLNLASNNTLSAVTASNNGSSGVSLSSASNNTLSGVTANNNDNPGIFLDSSNNNTLANLTANNNGSPAGSKGASAGITLWSSNKNTLSAVAASNNGNPGVYLRGGSSSNTLLDVTASNNGNTGVTLDSASDNRFTGLLKVGSNSPSDCGVIGGTNPGLVDATCADNGSSDATLTTGITLASSFVGKVASDDAGNASDSNGAAGFPADPTVFDWLHFDNAYRGWGIDGSAFPNADQQGRWTTGAGRIWDWSLPASDAVLRNVLALPTGNDTLTQVWSGAPGTNDNAGCNALLAGSVWNGSACATTFLRRAVEIPGDGVGNDNDLCESGETCLYAPNIGSYQGHGNLVSAGTFTDGALTGITLMKYATNGR